VIDDASPTARALLALELVQGSPGISAERLADKLGVSERATRRYVAILREAGIPIESVVGFQLEYFAGSVGLHASSVIASIPARNALS
jgi:predicted DNA-binding transcriptional regulator YafY